MGKHHYQITWLPAEGQSEWTFTKITQADQSSALPDPPFSGVTVSDGQITLQDDNNHGLDHGRFSYSLQAKSGDQYYWSDPEIMNKGGN